MTEVFPRFRQRSVTVSSSCSTRAGTCSTSQAGGKGGPVTPDVTGTPHGVTQRVPNSSTGVPMHWDALGTSQSIPVWGEPLLELGIPGVTQWGVPVTSGVTGPPFPPAWLVLQVLAGAVVEVDMMTLCCQMWQNKPVTSVSFYRKGKELGMLRDGTELSLSPRQLNHSGHYRCKGWVTSWSSWWEKSAPVAVTVRVSTPQPPPQHPHSPSTGTRAHKTPSPLL